ncbi:hypothetical protein, conserved [Angomonas deanei]|uniref:Uncharacterized protein n=1 Tax=Angomonas deanei TaxID=59799 RepID=A0A7G2C1S8_9TRYP|nr:hypothetical protein, conserved [Angomonas deanei]
MNSRVNYTPVFLYKRQLFGRSGVALLCLILLILECVVLAVPLAKTTRWSSGLPPVVEATEYYYVLQHKVLDSSLLDENSVVHYSGAAVKAFLVIALILAISSLVVSAVYVVLRVLVNRKQKALLAASAAESEFEEFNLPSVTKEHLNSRRGENHQSGSNNMGNGNNRGGRASLLFVMDRLVGLGLFCFLVLQCIFLLVALLVFPAYIMQKLFTPDWGERTYFSTGYVLLGVNVILGVIASALAYSKDLTGLNMAFRRYEEMENNSMTASEQRSEQFGIPMSNFTSLYNTPQKMAVERYHTREDTSFTFPEKQPQKERRTESTNGEVRTKVHREEMDSYDRDHQTSTAVFSKTQKGKEPASGIAPYGTALYDQRVESASKREVVFQPESESKVAVPSDNESVQTTPPQGLDHGIEPAGEPPEARLEDTSLQDDAVPRTVAHH